ncbi:SusC/RagA family TonB-linked outer membrane protein [Pedobacter sp.]|uniref:SusC/RagA family TonB-linked outer membrane protein n=1 Tax=Pedobacter sp. TaxID=1411316 RepID=UPI003D7F3599
MLNCYIKKGIVGLLLLVLGITSVKAQQVGSASPAASKEIGNAQNLTIVDEYGKPISGAFLYSSSNKLLGTTSEDGTVIVHPTKSDERITIYQKGYYPKTVKVSKTSLIKLTVDYLYAGESTNILYDTKANKQVLGAVASVNNNQIKTTPTSLYLNALTGRLPGFYTQEYNGFRSAKTIPITYIDLAGSLPNESVRYNSNLSDNSEMFYNLRGQQPVTIIDGVQRDIYSLDPENIESISVLKDALSTLLLGQKSSRGVLQITTRKGIAGPPRISFTAQTGTQNALKTPKPLSAYQYAYLYNEALQNSGRAPAFSETDFNSFRDGSSPTIYPNVNWYDQVLRDDSPITKYNLGVNGGGKNARYAIALSYMNQQGMFKSTDVTNTNLELNRYLINSSIDVDVTKSFSLGLQLFGGVQDGRQPGAGTGNILNNLYYTPNNAYPAFNPDGSYGGSSVYSTNLFQQVTGSGYLLDNNRDLMANLDLKYKFDNWVPGLYLKGKVNVSAASSSLINRSKVQPVYDAVLNNQENLSYTRYGSISDQPNSFGATSTANMFYAQATLGYDTQINNDHKIGGKLFVDQQIANYQFDLPSKYTNIAATADYSFKNRYFIEGAVNYSGFSRFQEGNRFGLFYAAGLGWDIASESFIKDNLKWINEFKLRGTYGRTGNTNENSLGYYSWRASYGQDGTNGYNLGSQYSFRSGIVEKGLANVNATWEKADKLNIGLDMALFNSHIKIIADVYRDEYFDLLQQRGSTIELIGMSYPNENIGRNLYAGQELSVTYQNKIKNFSYFITANASRMKTEVLYMNEIQQAHAWNNRTGMPVGQVFGYVADGLIQTQEEADKATSIAGTKVYPGDVKLVDLNNDGTINLSDQVPMGNTKPMIFYGATLGFSIKGFDFSVLLQGVKNRTYQQTDYAFGSGGDRQGYEYLLGRWTPETAETATYPRLTLGFNANNTPYLNNSSYWTRSGEYLRIKNIDVGYTLPYSFTNRIKVAGFRIFANAQNLFTTTPYDRLDPEIHGETSYPMQQIFNLGVNIKL